MGAVVPTGFEAYARVFPSLHVSEGKRLRWAELAAINGRVAHPLMELHLIASAAPGHGPSPWDLEPGGLGGPLPQEELRELAKVLREFTDTPALCWYCVWTGYGGIEESQARARIHLAGRDYFVSWGPLEEASSDEFAGPDIWWPDDHAWCVGSDVDLAASYVGGSAQCIEALLTSETLEALPVCPDDRVDINADQINRGGQ